MRTAMLQWRRTATTTDSVMCDRSIGNVAKQGCERDRTR